MIQQNNLIKLGNGIYLNPEEICVGILNWAEQTPEHVKKQQLENFGRILMWAGISTLVLSIISND